MSYCTACGAHLAPGASYCSSCGTQTTAPASIMPAAPAPLAAPAGATGPDAPVSQGAAVAALLLNILIWPGLGSLVAGAKVGWGQGFLFLGGLVLSLVLIGIPFAIGAWIWSIVTGVRLLNGVPPSRA